LEGTDEEFIEGIIDCDVSYVVVNGFKPTIKFLNRVIQFLYYSFIDAMVNFSITVPLMQFFNYNVALMVGSHYSFVDSLCNFYLPGRDSTKHPNTRFPPLVGFSLNP
jgi:hypothetical protein